jgi:hypothetical protein
MVKSKRQQALKLRLEKARETKKTGKTVCAEERAQTLNDQLHTCREEFQNCQGKLESCRKEYELLQERDCEREREWDKLQERDSEREREWNKLLEERDSEAKRRCKELQERNCEWERELQQLQQRDCEREREWKRLQERSSEREEGWKKLQKRAYERDIEREYMRKKEDEINTLYSQIEGFQHQLQVCSSQREHYMQLGQQLAQENQELREQNKQLQESQKHADNLTAEVGQLRKANAALTKQVAAKSREQPHNASQVAASLGKHTNHKFLFTRTSTAGRIQNFIHAPVSFGNPQKDAFTRRSNGICEYISTVSSGTTSSSSLESDCHDTLRHFLHKNHFAVSAALRTNGQASKVLKGGTLALQCRVGLNNMQVKELRRCLKEMNLNILESHEELRLQRKEMEELVHFYETDDVQMLVAATNEDEEGEAAVLEEKDMSVIRVKEGQVRAFVTRIVQRLGEDQHLVFPSQDTTPLLASDRQADFCGFSPSSLELCRQNVQVREAKAAAFEVTAAYDSDRHALVNEVFVCRVQL